MNRDLKSTARVLGIGERYLRDQLREMGVLNSARELVVTARTENRLFTSTRSRWNPSTNGWKHYGVVMTTEQGVAWLAEQLNITVTTMQPRRSGGRP